MKIHDGKEKHVLAKNKQHFTVRCEQQILIMRLQIFSKKEVEEKEKLAIINLCDPRDLVLYI